MDNKDVLLVYYFMILQPEFCKTPTFCGESLAYDFKGGRLTKAEVFSIADLVNLVCDSVTEQLFIVGYQNEMLKQ